MRFLSGVADGGEGSAALPSKRRPDRLLSRRAFNLLVVSGVAAVVGLVAARMVFTAGASPQTLRPIALTEVHPSPAPSPDLTATDPSLAEGGRHFEYAVGLHDLRGLPMDTRPGTTLDLWVAWDDAYADGPQVQKLAKGLTVARFVEPVTPEGPIVVVLSVPQGSMRAVMYGDLYGSFSVAKPTG